MSVFIKHCRVRSLARAYNVQLWRWNSTAAGNPVQEEEEEFRVLDIQKSRSRQQRKVARRADIQPNRADRMPTDQVEIIILIIGNFSSS